MTLDEATDEVRRLVGGTDGVVRVRAGEGSIVVYVSDPKAGNAVKSKYGGAYKDHPITVEKAVIATGILQVWPSRDGSPRARDSSGWLS